MAAKKKRGRKKARGRRKTVRASTALRAGSIITRKLSPATLKKQGVKLKAVGKMGGKTAYKVVRTSKPRASAKPRMSRAAKKTKRTRWRDTPAGRKSIAEGRARSSEWNAKNDARIKPGAILSASSGATMRFVTFFRVDKRENDRVVLTSLGQRYTWGDCQNGAVVPDMSKVGKSGRGKISGGSVKVGYRSYAYPWDGKPESVYGD